MSRVVTYFQLTKFQEINQANHWPSSHVSSGSNARFSTPRRALCASIAAATGSLRQRTLYPRIWSVNAGRAL
jgi:hypothetical protein